MAKKTFVEKIKDDFKPVSLIPEAETPTRERTRAVPGARLIPLTDIMPDPEQPRKKLDKEKLDELAASIQSKGVIEPITVRFIEGDNKYQIVTGERRYKAAKIAGLKEIPCIIKELDDGEALTYQLIENLQREDLSPVDEATALKRLIDNDFTQARISKLIGKSQPYVSQALKILDLPETILKEAQEKNLSKEHYLQLVKSEDPEKLWQQIQKTGGTAKEIKQKIDKQKPSRGRPKAKTWSWKPEDKSFTLSIRFHKKDFNKEELVKALNTFIKEIRHSNL